MMAYWYARNKNISKKFVCAVYIVLISIFVCGNSYADKKHHHHKKHQITLIQMTDLHGNMIPHAARIENPDGSTRVVTQGGGIAKIATVVKKIRKDNPNSLLLGTGDATHGSGETLFTMGDAIMPALNALGMDAYTPGNWDWGFGPAVFRNRFVDLCRNNPDYQFPPQTTPLCPPLPPNNRVMLDSDGVPGVTAAEFPTIAMNLYNNSPYPRTAPFFGKRVLDAYKIFDVMGIKIAVIGITSSIVPQQTPVFSRTFRFTQAVEELPDVIDEVNAQGAQLIVIQSELGLPQNVQIAREFSEVDVVLSAHTHELTLGAIIADAKGYEVVEVGEGPTRKQKNRLKKGAAIVVESGEDLYVGRLDIQMNGAGTKIRDFAWQAIPVDDDVEEDPEVAALVMEQEEPFIAGEDGEVQRHTFMPAGYCPAGQCGDIAVRGLQLVDDLNMVVGKTDVVLHRHHVLETMMNNFLADAMQQVLDPIVKAQTEWDGVDMSMTNGFRFDTEVLPASEIPDGATFWDGREPGEVTLRDLYSYYPIAPAIIAADFNGKSIELSLEGVLNSVFNKNSYLQRGGWYLGLSATMSQQIDLVNLPYSTSGSRVIQTYINDKPIDHSKRYVMASCYGHTFSMGRVCRTEGGANSIFFTLSDPDDYASAIGTAPPVNSEGIIDNRNGGPIRQAAPDGFLHPVKVVRRFFDTLDERTITEDRFGFGRVMHVNAKTPGLDPWPADEDPIPPKDQPYQAIIQPIEGLGPSFLDRNVNVSNYVWKWHD